MPPLDTNITPEQSAARAEAMKRVEQFGTVQTTASVPEPAEAAAEPAAIIPVAPPVPNAEAALTPAVAEPTTIAPIVAPELKPHPQKPEKKPETTVLTSKILPPIAKGNTPLPDELSLVNRLSNYIFDPNVSGYIKVAIGFGILIFIYLLFRIL